MMMATAIKMMVTTRMNMAIMTKTTRVMLKTNIKRGTTTTGKFYFSNISVAMTNMLSIAITTKIKVKVKVIIRPTMAIMMLDNKNPKLIRTSITVNNIMIKVPVRVNRTISSKNKGKGNEEAEEADQKKILKLSAILQ